ncbi:hypothetical protein, partial [Oleiphilus sp. HI0066]|uniref:hypothetical protein n=2 Tax=Oleiphilus TaxID=141450 RepID=UPI000AAABAA8
EFLYLAVGPKIKKGADMKKGLMVSSVIVGLFACSSSSGPDAPESIHINTDLSALLSDHAKVGSTHTF